jgi:hypothetical protein
MATALPLLSTEHPRLFIMKLAAGMFNSVPKTFVLGFLKMALSKSHK